MPPKKLDRRQSLQTIAWFNDLNKRQLLNLDPPYQRRSVWNLAYREFFIETILLGYPAPAVFLHEEIGPDGTAVYNVVDGKQRLTAIFDFASGEFPIAEDSVLSRLQGRYFTALSDSEKKSFWTYQFLVEYMPTTDEGTLNNIFDRINRNVAKLTRQELRHAKFDGRFARAAEDMAELLEEKMPTGVPHIAVSSKRQMKDVELVAQLLLLVEDKPEAFSQDDIDKAYSARDDEWEGEAAVRADFTGIVQYLSEMFLSSELSGFPAPVRRIKNQADFYSLFGAVFLLQKSGKLPEASTTGSRVASFIKEVTDDNSREINEKATRYYEAARSASNDAKQRNVRILIMQEVIQGITGV
ncbi:DUF262 domain-containing protein [Nocardiopsis alba]|uniref:DUF262 domain-containing protein n=1 Tax=Nocardiopsis alba TaxID=53437 RepID=UPI0033CB99B4